MKIKAHKRPFRALGTIVSRKFGHYPISHKVSGNTAIQTLQSVSKLDPLASSTASIKHKKYTDLEQSFKVFQQISDILWDLHVFAT